MEIFELSNLGALCFGLVVGWITYRTVRRSGVNGLSDISTVIGAVGGGAVTALFGEPEIFGAYSVGLALGFFGYFLTFLGLYGKGNPSEPDNDNRLMGAQPPIKP